MKKTVFHKITAVYIAILLLWSSLSFSVSLHYCDNVLKGIDLFEVASCEMPAKVQKEECGSCCQKPSAVTQRENVKSHCCSDQSVVHEGVYFQHNQPSELEKNQKVFPQSLLSDIYLSEVTVIFSTKELSFQNYTPPLLTEDVILLAERFLC